MTTNNTMNEYRVTIFKKFPAHDEMGGITYTTTAKNKSQAIRFIRREASDDGHIGMGQGRYTIRAEEVENP